eukprot:SAG22_NODE_2590_length_2409_cov_1.537229_2_plen_411_part_00
MLTNSSCELRPPPLRLRSRLSVCVQLLNTHTHTFSFVGAAACLPVCLSGRQLELFIKYQVPSDLLSYDESSAASLELTHVAAVREHVAAIKAMLEKAQAEELAAAERVKAEAEARAKARAAEEDRMLGPPGGAVGSGGRAFALGAAPRGGGFSGARDEIFGCDDGGGGGFSGARPEMAMAAAPQMAMARGGPVPGPPMKGKGGGRGGGSDKVRAAPAAKMKKKLGAALPAPAPASAPAPAPAPVPAPDAGAAPSLSPAPAPEDAETLDLTQLPSIIDSSFDALSGEDSGVRPTIIKAAPRWQKRFQKSLLSNRMETKSVELDAEKAAAFDLLDALSRSGALALDAAELHVIVAATHCFESSLMQTLVEDNVNPIDQCEKTTLVMAAAIQDVTPTRLVPPPVRERVQALLR